jgi:dienelactone hydrolase
MALAVLAVFACGPPRALPADGGSDAGAHDAGLTDASTPDAGRPPTDGGSVADGGSPDGGMPGDGGHADAGKTDSGLAQPLLPFVPCLDTLTTVYVTPSNLPPLTDAGRGDVVRCAYDQTLTQATVTSEVVAKGAMTPMTSGTAFYRIAFRTERGDGSPGVSTARVYLPLVPRELPMPLLAIGHGTSGLAAVCAPSMDATTNQDLALPWAGLGYAVIAPDYAGLGNEGVQGYLDNRDQAHSLLDSARALRKLLAPGVLSTQVLALGYSQGGGAALSAQALAKDYGLDGTLVGVVAFSPEWPTRLNSFGMVDQLLNPGELTIATGFSEDVVSVMRTYAYFYNRVGQAHAGDGFPDAGRAGIDSAVTSQCLAVLGGYLQVAAPLVGEITDPALRTGLLACIQAGPADSGCVDPGASYYAFLEQNIVHADPAGARVLYVQGLADFIMPPASEGACNIAKLEADGVSPQVAVDSAGQHTTVTGRNVDFAISWCQALLAGQPLPAYVDGGTLPACTP